MKKITFIILMLMLAYSSYSQEMPKSYICYRIAKPINIDGNISHKEWSKAPWSDYFTDIEGDSLPSPEYKTRVKMLWDDQYFYVAAELEEPHIWATLTERDAVIFHDNDFEVFIDPDGDNQMYYEFEINALNTVWDLLLNKPYKDGGKAIDSWDIRGLKSAVKVYGTINDPSDTDEKWTVEIAFPWKVLEECSATGNKPKDGEQWRINFSRVNWKTDKKNGKYTKSVNPETGKIYPEYNWVWSPQYAINMHLPERWGYVQFSTAKAGSKEVIFADDPDFKLKELLCYIYYAQKELYNLTGKYLGSEITSSTKYSKDYKISIEVTSRQFIAWGKADSDKIWYINQDGRLWYENDDKL